MKNKITADNPLWLNTLINDNRKLRLENEDLKRELDRYKELEKKGVYVEKLDLTQLP